MIKTERFEKVEVASAPALRDWLAAHHQRAEGVWLVTFKKHVAGKYVSRDEVLDELVAYGWIDGVRRVLDEDRTMQLISPRRTQAWAKTYKDRAAILIDGGRMAPPGLRSIEEGKASGLWSFFDDVDALIAPPDLVERLEMAKWAPLAPSYRRNLLRWLKLAKTPATREKRLTRIAEAVAKGERIPQM
ncbi:MAG: YdeI/OmpD-associated family protein [Pseudomonadota bacterium]